MPFAAEPYNPPGLAPTCPAGYTSIMQQIQLTSGMPQATSDQTPITPNITSNILSDAEKESMRGMFLDLYHKTNRDWQFQYIYSHAFHFEKSDRQPVRWLAFKKINEAGEDNQYFVMVDYAPWLTLPLLSENAYKALKAWLPTLASINPAFVRNVFLNQKAFHTFLSTYDNLRPNTLKLQSKETRVSGSLLDITMRIVSTVPSNRQARITEKHRMVLNAKQAGTQIPMMFSTRLAEGKNLEHAKQYALDKFLVNALSEKATMVGHSMSEQTYQAILDDPKAARFIVAHQWELVENHQLQLHHSETSAGEPQLTLTAVPNDGGEAKASYTLSLPGPNLPRCPSFLEDMRHSFWKFLGYAPARKNTPAEIKLPANDTNTTAQFTASK
ncbi:MAG: hypothetical protein DHS20C10_05110 [marine bacterium B5-7]|nr:MAG: hypothetical protein DHS20C10_05110 [marine bacterium B5-7]